MHFLGEGIRFYNIDFEYIKFLHSYDNQVYYHASYQDKLKPYIGIIVTNDGIHYFIPLTSAKPAHAHKPLNGSDYMMIHRLVDVSENERRAIYKPYGEDRTKKYRITSLLNIGKMIPVPANKVKAIDFKSLDMKYQFLLLEEHRFCVSEQDRIVAKAKKLYTKTKQKGKRLGKEQCDYLFLERLIHRLP